MRHSQNKVTKEITLDQNHYVSTLRSISHPQLTRAKMEDFAEPEVHELYRSLLGAVAYLSHTRLDVNVFICALQRHGHKPQIQHVKKLNKLLSWLRKNPKKLHYKNFVEPRAGGSIHAEASSAPARHIFALFLTQLSRRKMRVASVSEEHSTYTHARSEERGCKY